MWEPPKTPHRRILRRCDVCGELHPSYADVSPRICQTCVLDARAASLEELLDNQPKISRYKYDSIYDR